MSRFVVGLTGGIGSGKSTVADCFARLGAAVVDTDRIAHELTGAGGAAMPALRAEFGTEVVTASGALDRAAMRRRVFDDPAARRRLEAILHPLIRAEAAGQCDRATEPYVILVVPLLIEAGDYQRRVDRVLVVDCPEETQIARVMQRSGLGRDEVAAIMAAQASRADRLAAADDVVLNAAGLEILEEDVRRLHAAYLKQAAVLKADC